MIIYICQIFVYPLEKPVEQTNWCWDKQCQNVCKRTSLPWSEAHKRFFTLVGSRILSGVNFTNIGEIDSHAKVLNTAFKCLQFGFVIFCRKDFVAKAAHKMLVKLTLEQYFILIKRNAQTFISETD